MPRMRRGLRRLRGHEGYEGYEGDEVDKGAEVADRTAGISILPVEGRNHPM